MGRLPAGVGGRPTPHPSSEILRPPDYAAEPPSRSCPRLVIAVSVTTAVAVATLVVSLTRPAAARPSAPCTAVRNSFNGNYGVATGAQYQVELNDVIAKYAAMKKVSGVG